MRSAGVLHVQRADRASERGPFDAQGLRSIIANNARRRRRGSKKIIHCAGERRFASAAHSEKRVLCVSWIGVQLRGPTHPACMTSKSHFLHVSHTRICTSKIICICFQCPGKNLHRLFKIRYACTCSGKLHLKKEH
jgi:hypothetical protein